MNRSLLSVAPPLSRESLEELRAAILASAEPETYRRSLLPNPANPHDPAIGSIFNDLRHMHEKSRETDQ